MPKCSNAQCHYFECIHIAVLNIRSYTGLSMIVHAWLHSATIPSRLCCTDSRPNIPTPSPALHIVCQKLHRYHTSNTRTAYTNSIYPDSDCDASRPVSLLSKNIDFFTHKYASWQPVGWRNGSAWPSYPSGYHKAKVAGSSPVLIEMRRLDGVYYWRVCSTRHLIFCWVGGEIRFFLEGG
jgi:hypothetical protein